MNPAATCPACQSFDFEIVESAGYGRIFTYTVVHHGSHPATMGAVPYTVATIQLDDCDSVKLLSNIVGCDTREVHIGMPVELVWDDVNETLVLPRFRPRSG